MKTNTKILPQEFFTPDEVVGVAKDLLGKILVSTVSGIRTSGMIVETEAYKGPEDRACHAYNNRRTPRTEIMFHEGGVAYVYICYGIHHLFNVVSGKKDQPHAVLIRGLEPLEGNETMLKRRNLEKFDYRICGGPGALAQALGITSELSGISLQGPIIQLEDHGINIFDQDIIASKRVGCESAGEDGLLPWRFRISGNRWASPAK